RRSYGRGGSAVKLYEILSGQVNPVRNRFGQMSRGNLRAQREIRDGPSDAQCAMKSAQGETHPLDSGRAQTPGRCVESEDSLELAGGELRVAEAGTRRKTRGGQRARSADPLPDCARGFSAGARLQFGPGDRRNGNVQIDP